MSDSRGPVLEARGVSVRFGRLEALRNVSLEVGAGEAVGIVGESGSGKTTLARVLAGLSQPTVGAVQLLGRQVIAAGGPSRYQRADRRLVQLIFQDPYSSLDPKQRAWQAVAEALQVWSGLSRSVARQRAMALLKSVGISESQAALLPHALSGGQRQRVSTARALAVEPLILIADEPTSSIDQSAQAQMLNLLSELQEQRHLAVVFISHDLMLVRYFARRTYVMKDGEVVEHGRSVDIFDAPKHPYTQMLVESTPGRRKLTSLSAQDSV